MKKFTTKSHHTVFQEYKFQLIGEGMLNHRSLSCQLTVTRINIDDRIKQTLFYIQKLMNK